MDASSQLRGVRWLPQAPASGDSHIGRLGRELHRAATRLGDQLHLGLRRTAAPHDVELSFHAAAPSRETASSSSRCKLAAGFFPKHLFPPPRLVRRARQAEVPSDWEPAINQIDCADSGSARLFEDCLSSTTPAVFYGHCPSPCTQPPISELMADSFPPAPSPSGQVGTICRRRPEPEGPGHACRSPRATRRMYQEASSPCLANPQLASEVSSPRLASPRLVSPRLTSPRELPPDRRSEPRAARLPAEPREQEARNVAASPVWQREGPCLDARWDLADERGLSLADTLQHSCSSCAGSATWDRDVEAPAPTFGSSPMPSPEPVEAQEPTGRERQAQPSAWQWPTEASLPEWQRQPEGAPRKGQAAEAYEAEKDVRPKHRPKEGSLRRARGSRAASKTQEVEPLSVPWLLDAGHDQAQTSSAPPSSWLADGARAASPKEATDAGPLSLTELCPVMQPCSTEEQLRGFTSPRCPQQCPGDEQLRGFTSPRGPQQQCSVEQKPRGFTSPRGLQQQCSVEQQLRGCTSPSGLQKQEQLRCASAATQELPQQCLTGEVRRCTAPHPPRNVPTQRPAEEQPTHCTPPTSPRNLPQQGPVEEQLRRRPSISPNDLPSAAAPISSGKYLSRLASTRRLAAAEVGALEAPDVLLQTAVSEEPLPRAWRRVTARAASPRQPAESQGQELLCSVSNPGAALPSETWQAASTALSPRVRRPSPAELWLPTASSKCCVPSAMALEPCCAEGSGYVAAVELGLGLQVEDSLQKSSPQIVEDTDPTVVQRTAEDCTRWGLKDNHGILAAAAKLPSKVLASSPVDGTVANKSCSRTVRPIERLWTAAYAGLQASEQEVPPGAPWGEPTEATVQHSPGWEASLSPEMEQRLRLVFECCSPDSQDAVTYQQVRSACDEHPEFAKLLGARICSDQSGNVTWSDFKALLATQRTEVVRLSDAEAEAVVCVVFKLCDRKNRGTVALLDVHRVCMRQPAISAFLGLPGGDEGWEEAAEAAFPELFLGDLRKMDLTLFTRRVLEARRSTSSKGSLCEKRVVNAGPLPRSVGEEVPKSSAAATSSDCGNATLKHEEEECKPPPEKKHHHHHHHKKHRCTDHSRESDDSGVSHRKHPQKSRDDSSGRSRHHHRRHHHRHDQDSEAGQERSSHHHRSHRSSPEERWSERGSSRSHLERKHHHEMAQPEVRAEGERTRAEASAPSGSLRAAGTVVRQAQPSWGGQRSTKEEGKRHSAEAPKAPQTRREHDARLLRTEEVEAVRREARRRTEERKHQEQEEQRRREVEAAAKSARDRRGPQEVDRQEPTGRRSSQELEFWRLEAMQRARSLEQRSQHLAEKKREQEKQQEEQEAKQKREQIQAWREEAVRRSEARERRQSIHARPSSAGALGKGL